VSHPSLHSIRHHYRPARPMGVALLSLATVLWSNTLDAQRPAANTSTARATAARAAYYPGRDDAWERRAPSAVGIGLDAHR
jgi:hypothetical protein